jgi:mRNA-degrading endonuclease RelE of RelBE toxin-antitoxin system
MNEEKTKNIEYSKKFLKSLRKLPNRIIESAEEKEIIFKEDPFDVRLNTHKLSGRDKGCLAFWINDSYRIKFLFLPDGEVLFLNIGTHNIYK